MIFRTVATRRNPASRLALALAALLMAAADEARAWERTMERVAFPGGLSVNATGDVALLSVSRTGFQLEFVSSGGAPRWSSDRFELDLGTAVTDSGDVVRRFSDDGTDTIEKRNAGGALLWQRSTAGVISPIVFDSAGAVITSDTSTALLSKLDGASGMTVWDSPAAVWPGDMLLAADASDDVIVGLGNIFPPTDHPFQIAKLAGTTGAIAWSYAAADPDTDVVALGVAPSGDVTIVETLGTQSEVVQLAGTNGTEQVRQVLPVRFGGQIALDSSGNAFVTHAPATSALTTLTLEKRSAADGTVLWSIDFAGYLNSDGHRLATTPDDGIVMAVRLKESTSAPLRVMKLANADGAEIWRQDLIQRNLGFDFSIPYGGDLAGLAIDANGDVTMDADMVNRVNAAPHIPNPLDHQLLRLSGVDGSDPIGTRSLRLRHRAGQVALSYRSETHIGVSPVTADPTIDGAVLDVRNPSTGESTTVSLPASGWQRLQRKLGFETVVKGYRFRGTGPCKRVRIVANRRVAIDCPALPGFTLDEASQGTIALRLTAGTGATARRYCAQASGSVSDAPGAFQASAAAPPASCAFP